MQRSDDPRRHGSEEKHKSTAHYNGEERREDYNGFWGNLNRYKHKYSALLWMLGLAAMYGAYTESLKVAKAERALLIQTTASHGARLDRIEGRLTITAYDNCLEKKPRDSYQIEQCRLLIDEVRSGGHPR